MFGQPRERAEQNESGEEAREEATDMGGEVGVRRGEAVEEIEADEDERGAADGAGRFGADYASLA